MIHKKTVVVVLFGVMFLLMWSVVVVQRAWAHGSMEDPVARVYQCYLEGPEHPSSAACQAAVQAGGTQEFYDWNGVNLLAADQHRQLIPDGQLCSAGKDSHRGLDLARSDWVAQPIAPDQNGNYTFVFLATAPHATKYFDFYITKDSYDPTQPLKWSDLEDTPFCHITSVTLRNGRYSMTCPLPHKTGKRLIYNIWQRSDSAEAFYSCMDVEMSRGGGATGTPTAVGPPPTSTQVAPTATPQPGATTTPVGATPTPTLMPTRPATATTCQVQYNVVSDSGSSFQTEVVITNTGSAPINQWTLTWAFPGNQLITSLWNGKVSQTGSGVLVNNQTWNAVINANGGQVDLGFVATYSGINRAPLTFLVNGAACMSSSNLEAPPATETNAVYLPMIKH
ncbi:MAG: lytic polysaccharide monooxygenase [Caldilineaceae bacterium]